MPSYTLECPKCENILPYSGKYSDAIAERCEKCKLTYKIVFLPGTNLPQHQGQTTRGPGSRR